MGNKCGQCGQNYSKECEKKINCNIHKGPCFSCHPCSSCPETSLDDHCSLCLRRCSSSDLYLDFNCGKYICRAHFLKSKDIEKKTFRMPCCQQQEITEHVLNFMNGYCILCGRKLIQAKENSLELGVCQPCEKNRVSLENQLAQNEQIPPNFQACPIVQPEKECQVQEFLSNEDSLHWEVESGTARSHKQKMEAFNKEMQRLKEQNKVEEYHRNLLKLKLMEESREKDCPVCYEQFNLRNRSPMLVCLGQHLICQNCFSTKNITFCPLCRADINKACVKVSRERTRTLQLEELAKKSYKQRLDEYLAKNRQFSPCQYVNVEVQTDKEEPQKPPEKPVRRRKNAGAEGGKGAKKAKTMES